MATNQALQARREAAVPRGIASMLPVFPDRAENSEIWDVEGRRLIDFAGGIAVLNTGHRHPRVLQAVRDQLDHYTHTCFQVLPYEPYIRLAERLNALAPSAAPNKTIFLTTGAEAVENAVKIAREYTKRPAVVAFSGGFHGRTLMTMSLTGKVKPYKVGGPFTPHIYHVPFPDAYRGVTVGASLAALDTLFRCDVDPSGVAAIIIEPVQGEGGFVVAPFDFLEQLRSLCNRHGIVLIADEVQSGFGRTGRLFAMEHSGVAPDLTTVAKSLAGGFPLSAVIGRAEIMDSVGPGGLGGTYAGSPVACAAANAVLDVIEDERLLDRAMVIGETIAGRMRTLAVRNLFSNIGEVRGLGAMIAVELVKDRTGREPAPELTAALVKAAAARGLVILACGVYGNVIRFLVPLTASDALVAEGLSVFEEALASVVTAEG
ncbi:MAG: 4-aminobutyrate--2-oxoglutarate transaminase [Azospirillum sp.]|nr:4-aminobutyrate--2-oxoglutarate transaminase [Azospirillum sp.]